MKVYAVIPFNMKTPLKQPLFMAVGGWVLGSLKFTLSFLNRS